MSASPMVRVGDLSDQVLVLGQGEVGADFHIHLEDHRPVIGQLDGVDVEVRLRDRIELVLLVELFQAGHQQGLLDLAGDLLAKPLLDELARGMAGPEAGDHGLLGHVAERVLELLLDIRARDADLQMFLARPDFADLYVQVESRLGRECGRTVFGGIRRIEVFFPGAHRRRSFGATGWDGLGRHHAPDAIERKPPARLQEKMEREMGFEPTTITLAT